MGVQLLSTSGMPVGACSRTQYEIIVFSVKISVFIFSDGIPDANYTNKLRDLWKGVVPPSSDLKVAAEENDAGTFSMTNIVDKMFPLPDSTVASDSPVTTINENENENEVDLVNRLQLCTRSKTFAENCLAQYQLSFRRKVPIDLKPPCETLTNMRALHCTWSALAYTLYSNSSVWRWTDDDIHADVVDRNASRATEERKAIELGMHVMFAARNAVNWMGRFDFRGAVLIPMRRLLSGASLCRSDSLSTDGVLNGVMRYSRCVLIETAACLENECDDILLSLPTKTVGTPGFPNPKRILATLAICRNKGVAETKLWPVLSQPLLLQDLSVIAVAAVCSCSNLFGSLELIALFGIARLAQLLIEPACNGNLSLQNIKLILDRLYANTVNTGISISNLQSDFYYHLNSIRDRMCGTCGIPVTSFAPKDSDLLLNIIDSWIPFLQFLNLLRKVVLFSSESLNNSNIDNINSNAQDMGIKENILNDGTGELQGFIPGVDLVRRDLATELATRSTQSPPPQSGNPMHRTRRCGKRGSHLHPHPNAGASHAPLRNRPPGHRCRPPKHRAPGALRPATRQRYPAAALDPPALQGLSWKAWTTDDTMSSAPVPRRTILSNTGACRNAQRGGSLLVWNAMPAIV